MVLLVSVGGVYLLCCSATCLASNLLSMNIGADSNIGRVSPSSSCGSNSVSSIAGKRSGNMSIGNRRGNNVVISGGHGSNMVVGGGEGRGNSVGGSKRSSMGVDQSGVSFGLT